MGIKSEIKGTIKNIRGGSSNYGKIQEQRHSRTSAGTKMLEESKEQVANLKSAPKRMAKAVFVGVRRIATSTGSMVSRGVQKMVPKRTINISN